MADHIASAPKQDGFKRIERGLEAFLFGSRWLAVPIYIGFIVALALLVIKFVEEVWHAVPKVLDMPARDLIVAALELVDLSFAVNLLIIVMFSGFENFVSRIAPDGHEDRPEWLDKIDFGALKLKLISSIAAISAIDLLQRFMDIEHQNHDDLLMLGGLQLLFVVSGVLLAVMDRVSGSKHRASPD